MIERRLQGERNFRAENDLCICGHLRREHLTLTFNGSAFDTCYGEKDCACKWFEFFKYDWNKGRKNKKNK